MGKAKRFNSYDQDIQNQRNIVQGYGHSRSHGMTSTFRNSPPPPTSDFNPTRDENITSVGDNLGNHTATTNLNLNSNKVINLTTPSADYDASTKKYVDDSISGLTSFANTDLSNLTSTGESHFVKANASSTTFAGNIIFDTVLSGSTSDAPVKFQGDGTDTAQRILEIGEFGDHSVLIIAELTGNGGATISDPAVESGDLTLSSSEKTISLKTGIVMNTYNIYDLDQLVFAQGLSTLTPALDPDWVAIEAEQDNSGTLEGLGYNVPTGKKHIFNIQGSSKVAIHDDVEFEAGGTVDFNDIATSATGGSATALPSNPTAYFKVKYQGQTRYIPYYS